MEAVYEVQDIKHVDSDGGLLGGLVQLAFDGTIWLDIQTVGRCLICGCGAGEDQGAALQHQISVDVDIHHTVHELPIIT